MQCMRAPDERIELGARNFVEDRSQQHAEWRTVNLVIEDELDVAAAIRPVREIPVADEMASDLYDVAIRTALADADSRGIRGRAVTPFLLDRLHAVTGGESVRANLALLRHNAHVAAALAVAGV